MIPQIWNRTSSSLLVENGTAFQQTSVQDMLYHMAQESMTTSSYAEGCHGRAPYMVKYLQMPVRRCEARAALPLVGTSDTPMHQDPSILNIRRLGLIRESW